MVGEKVVEKGWESGWKGCWEMVGERVEGLLSKGGRVVEKW